MNDWQKWRYSWRGRTQIAWFVTMAAVVQPRAALLVFNTLVLWWYGYIYERPCRGLAVILPWRWTQDMEDIWTKKTLHNERVERIVTFFLDPKHNEVSFDTFVGIEGPPLPRHPWRKRLPLTMPEGAQFPVLS